MAGAPVEADDDFGTDNTPRKSDAVNQRRQLAAHDRKMSDAYQAGRGGMPADPDYDDDQAAAHASGAEEAAQPAAAPPVTASPSRPFFGNPNQAGGRAQQIKAEGAPLILGMVGYCLAVNWIRYGWPGVTGWFTAKFENKVTLGVPAKPVTTGNGKATTTAPGSVTGSDKHGTHGK